MPRWKQRGRTGPCEAVKLIRRACPLSVACAFDIIRRARSFKQIERALELEYRFALVLASRTTNSSKACARGDRQGPQAELADQRIEDVTPEMVAAMLAPVVPQQAD